MKTTSFFKRGAFLFAFVAAASLPALWAQSESRHNPIDKLYVEGRMDFQDQHNTFAPNDDKTSQYGFTGKFFNLGLAGKVGDHWSYRIVQRIVANPGSHRLFDNTDNLYLTYHHTKNVSFRVGRDAFAYGGFEFDYLPIDIMIKSYNWEAFNCYNLGASMIINSDDNNHKLWFQVNNSPYQHFNSPYLTENQNTGLGKLMAYSLYYSFTSPEKHLNVIHSTNFFEYQENHFLNITILGHRLNYGDFSVWADLYHYSLGTDDWFKSYLAMAQVEYAPVKELNVFAKVSFERNESEHEISYASYMSGLALSHNYLAIPQQDRLCYGIGFEYFPFNFHRVRLHAFVCNTQFTHPDLLNPSGDKIRDNSLEVNLGLSWRLDAAKIFSNIYDKLQL